MSKTDLKNEARSNHDQHRNAGSDSHNVAQDLFDREFNGITAGLSDVDGKMKGIVNDNADEPDKNIQKTREGERDLAPHLSQKQATPRSQPRRWQAFNKKLRGKSSIITVALILFGGGGAMTLFMSPSLAIIQLKEVLTQDLNDQLKALDNRSNALLRSKLKDTTRGSCGAVKIACRFSTISDKQAERFRAAGIEIDRDMSKGFSNKRGQITRMTFTDPNTGVKTYITNAGDLTKHSLGNVDFRAAMLKAYNPKFAGMTDKVAMRVLKIAKATKTPQVQGDTEEERRENLNRAVSSGAQADTNSLRPQLDEEGRETGSYVDEHGNIVDGAEQRETISSGSVGENAARVGSKNLLGSVAKGISPIGWIDTSCTVYNSSRALSALAKVKKKAMAIRFVFGAVFSVADKNMAGDGDEGENVAVGNMMTQTDTRDKVVDETKWDEAGTADNPPEVDNPDRNKAAFDGPGLKAAMFGDVTPLDSRSSRFLLGWGFSGTLDRINQLIAKSLGTDPKGISRKCKLVQNPFVRIGALGVGVIAGAGSFGLSTAAGITASLAIGFALPYVLSITADLMAGNLFKDLAGMDFGDGAFVGAAGYMGDVAMTSGMKPLSAQEAVAYTNENKKTSDNIAATERYIARTTPLDINNQYSFLGSFTRSILPFAREANVSAGAAALSLASFVPTGLGLSTQTAKAANPIERFQQCKDPAYERLGIGADIFCNVRYGLSDKELAIDPIENALWMANTGNIDPTSETVSPKDNGQEWNYEKYLKECPNRTVGWGEDQDENQGDGENCLSKKNEGLNERFRIFTLDARANDAMDEESDGSTPGTSGVTDGVSGAVSSDGWAYPTTPDAKMTSGFKDPGRGDNHLGVDLAQDGAAGKPIFAASDGKVVAAGPADGFGNWIIVQHDVGGKRYDSVYGHMFDDGVLVKVGDTVKAGQQIGKIGYNGSVSPPGPGGAHLHFEIWEGGRFDGHAIDPAPIINGAKTAPSGEAARNA
jgi:biotin carboxyl carrier protein